MQVVLLRVVVWSGVRGVRVVAIGVAGLALDVEQRRVGQEGRAGQPQRVLRVRVAGLRMRVRVQLRRVRRPAELRMRGLRRGVRLAPLRAVTGHGLCQRERHLRDTLLAICNLDV